MATTKKRKSEPDPTIEFARKILMRLGERPPAVTLTPDPHADTAIERFVFSLNPTRFRRRERPADAWSPEVVFNGLEWGQENGWIATGRPHVPFKVQELTINVPGPGVCYVEVIQAGDTNAQLGQSADAATFRSGRALSLPWLARSEEMKVQGTWTAHIPQAFMCGARFLLAIDVIGWAKRS
jgi:hypothetical protein